MKVLVVEDSNRLRNALEEGLRRSRFVVDVAADGRSGLSYAMDIEYDVIVLDIMLLAIDGLSLRKELRNQNNPAKVLLLTAKGQVADRLKGLETGADDYLVKPFVFEELVARIRTLGRRNFISNGPIIRLDRISIDTDKCCLRVEEDEVSLTASEYNIVEYLALRRGKVVTKGQLRDMLSNASSETVSNTVEVLVSSIRRKFDNADAGAVIHTKRGFGYYVE